jgi:GxxExxY protein
MEEKNDKETYAIIGAAMEVHKELGQGFLENVYQEALASEFALKAIPYKREVELPVTYKGKRLNTAYRVDFLCYDEIIVEIKALDELTGRETAQVLNYLKAGKLERALLINFGAPSLQCERLVNQFNPNLRKSAKSADKKFLDL